MLPCTLRVIPAEPQSASIAEVPNERMAPLPMGPRTGRCVHISNSVSPRCLWRAFHKVHAVNCLHHLSQRIETRPKQISKTAAPNTNDGGRAKVRSFDLIWPDGAPFCHLANGAQMRFVRYAPSYFLQYGLLVTKWQNRHLPAAGRVVPD